MNKTTPLFIALLFLVFISAAQKQSRIDSLLTLLKTDKEDTGKVSHYNRLGKEYSRIGSYDTAFMFAEKALMLAKQLDFKSGIANAYENTGNIYFRHGSYDKAMESHVASLKIRKEINDKKGIAVAYNNIANIYFNRSSKDTALENYKTALKIFEEIGDKTGIISCSGNIGMIYANTGNYNKALGVYLAVLKMAEKDGDWDNAASTYNDIGNVYDNEGIYDKALENYLLAQKIYRSHDAKYGIAALSLNIGNIYYRQKKYDQALKSYFEALEMRKQMNDLPGISQTYNNMADIYELQNNYDKALETNLASLKIAEEIGNKGRIAFSHNNIGNVYRKQSKYDKALENYLIALKGFEELKDKASIANTELNIGVIYGKQKKLAEAEKKFMKALTIDKEIGNRDGMREDYSTVSQFYDEQKEYKKSLDYYKLSSAMKDSLFNEASEKRIADMNTKYETEKKDKEITQLNFDKERSKSRQNAIILSGSIVLASGIIIAFLLFNRRKTKHKLQINKVENIALRSQLNPHFIFNALNSIQKYMRLHPDIAEEYLVKFSKLMREVLENSEKEFISLDDEFAMLNKYMDLEKLRVPNGFDYKIKAGDGVDMESLQMPPLLLQPIIENAIWHGISGKSEKGNICIDVTMKDHSLLFAIENQCKGAAINTTKGDEIKKKSFGLQIVRERLSLLSREKKRMGTLQMIPLDNGMKVVLNVPV